MGLKPEDGFGKIEVILECSLHSKKLQNDDTSWELFLMALGDSSRFLFLSCD